MSNRLLSGPSSPSSRSARSKWPVEEIGRNSVSPSTMPRRTAEANRAESMTSTGLPTTSAALADPSGGVADRERSCQGDDQPLRRASIVLQRARSVGEAMSTNHPANIDVAAALAEAQE